LSERSELICLSVSVLLSILGDPVSTSLGKMIMSVLFDPIPSK